MSLALDIDILEFFRGLKQSDKPFDPAFINPRTIKMMKLFDSLSDDQATAATHLLKSIDP